MPGLIASKEVQASPQYAAANDYAIQTTTSLEEAIDQFSDPVESQATSGNDDALSESLHVSWRSITSLAADTAFTEPGMQRLVDFVLELQNRSDVEVEGKARVVESMKLWSDLPLFGWQMRDAWNFAPQDDKNETFQQQWVNLNAWTASLVSSAHANAGDKPDFTLYAIWSIRSALEEEKPPSDSALMAASVWFIFAAPALRDLSEKGKVFDGKFAAPGFAFKDREWRGFSKDRWDAWSEKLKAAQEGEQATVAARLARQAYEAFQSAS